jgi:cytochrome c-type biogenesis protein CcmH
MPTFWLLAALLVAALLAALLWPLLRRRAPLDAPDADVASLAVYRDQKRSLDGELAAGTITAAEHDNAITELTRLLAEETATEAAPAPMLRRGSHKIAALLLVVIPVAAVALYYKVGNPTASGAIEQAQNKQELSDQQITAMVDSLSQRMKQNPTDAQGWTLLAHSYHALERYAEAADAYAHANELVKGDAGLLVDYADALAMAQGKTLAGRPEALVQQALAIDPQNRKALALAAAGALELHDRDGSLVYWRRLAATLPPGSEEIGQVNAFIAQLEGSKTQSAPAGAAPQAAVQPQQARSSASNAGASGAEAITGHVDLSPQLASKVSPGDIVFIFARSTEGPRMPLAALRTTARDLPQQFTLDATLSMAPGAKLSGAASVVIEARISKHGSAMPQPGDLFARASDIKPGSKGINLTIDQVVP